MNLFGELSSVLLSLQQTSEHGLMKKGSVSNNLGSFLAGPRAKQIFMVIRITDVD